MMGDEREWDHLLRRQFTALRESDAHASPDFGELIAQARNAADAHTTPLMSQHATAPSRRAWRRVALYAAGPMLTAAGLAAVLFNANRRAEREFAEAVSEWSQTTAQLLRAPTDGLLVLPGDEFLRTTPTVGHRASNLRSGS